MGPKTRLLADSVRRAIALLDRANAHHWRDWFASALSQIENGDLSGVNHVLAAYGGMGSFNDLVLDPLNGYRGAPSECTALNEQLDTLRSQMWDLGNAIRRDAEQSHI